MADTAHPWAEVDENTARFWMGASWKIRQNGVLQRNVGGVQMALLKRNLSSTEGGRLDITPKWVDIQTCIITCSA